MSLISARILRRVVDVGRGSPPPPALLAQAGLADALPPAGAPPRMVPAEVYYALLEHCAAGDDGLPVRYGAAIQPDDFGAFGHALKTARDVQDVLQRLARYILVVSDTLDYALLDGDGADRVFVLRGRPAAGRRGIELANECALAAIVSLLRQVAEGPVAPVAVSFRHAAPADAAAHAAFFGCALHFGAAVDGIHLPPDTLGLGTRLADEGLSAFLLAQLDAQHALRAEGAVVVQVRREIADTLCAGMPSRDAVARRLGMSARTLARRLAEHGQSFQDIANQVRREVAESHLARPSVSLAEVAWLTGFSDQSAFQRAFKTWTGQTPGAFQQALA